MWLLDHNWIGASEPLLEVINFPFEEKIFPVRSDRLSKSERLHVKWLNPPTPTSPPIDNVDIFVLLNPNTLPQHSIAYTYQQCSSARYYRAAVLIHPRASLRSSPCPRSRLQLKVNKSKCPKVLIHRIEKPKIPKMYTHLEISLLFRLPSFAALNYTRLIPSCQFPRRWKFDRSAVFNHYHLLF